MIEKGVSFIGQVGEPRLPEKSYHTIYIELSIEHACDTVYFCTNCIHYIVSFPKMIEKSSKLCKHACSYIEYMLNCKVTTCSCYFSWILNNSYVIVKLNKEEG